jgi:hypothetical protein
MPGPTQAKPRGLRSRVLDPGQSRSSTSREREGAEESDSASLTAHQRFLIPVSIIPLESFVVDAPTQAVQVMRQYEFLMR